MRFRREISLGAVLAFAATGSGPFGAGSTPALVCVAKMAAQPIRRRGPPGEAGYGAGKATRRKRGA
jgi:hypothetical protein